MVTEPQSRRQIDWLLLTEVALLLASFGLGVALYWIPAASEPFLPRWWTGLLLGGLFFGALGLDVWRRHRRRRAALREALQEASERSAPPV